MRRFAVLALVVACSLSLTSVDPEGLDSSKMRAAALLRVASRVLPGRGALDTDATFGVRWRTGAAMRILNTERLRLRWFDEGDAPFVLALLNEPSWIQNIGDRGVRTLDDAAAWIRDRLRAGYLRLGFGFWAVERIEDGALVGMCGLTHRDSLPEVDVGYALLPRYWGRGYAREAAAACLRYAQEVLGLTHVLAITSPGNAASARVLEAIGLRFQGTRVLPGEEEETSVFAWHAPPAAPADDAAAIDALARRFFASFGNRDGALPTLAALPHWFVAGALVHRGDGDSLVSMGLRDFLLPRAELLQGGRLRDFAEHEIDHTTRIFGHVAQRWSRYRKSGRLDGEPYEGEGVKTMQLVKTPRGWKIAALAWEDARADLPLRG